MWYCTNSITYVAHSPQNCKAQISIQVIFNTIQTTLKNTQYLRSNMKIVIHQCSWHWCSQSPRRHGFVEA